MTDDNRPPLDTLPLRDHDTLIDVAARVAKIEEEVARQRDRWHDEVVPAMQHWAIFETRTWPTTLTRIEAMGEHISAALDVARRAADKAAEALTTIAGHQQGCIESNRELRGELRAEFTKIENRQDAASREREAMGAQLRSRLDGFKFWLVSGVAGAAISALTFIVAVVWMLLTHDVHVMLRP